jgi:hypothetical protein
MIAEHTLARQLAQPADRRHVRLGESALRELTRKSGVGVAPQGEHHHAGRVAVEPLVHAQIHVVGGDAAPCCQPALEPRDDVVVVARIGSLRRHSGRLVDRDQIVILVEDPALVEVAPEFEHCALGLRPFSSRARTARAATGSTANPRS